MPCRFALAASLFAASAGGFSSACSAAQLGDVEHIIVIYLENHSFDNLFGFFPGAGHRDRGRDQDPGRPERQAL
jgi:phospholipase C